MHRFAALVALIGAAAALTPSPKCGGVGPNGLNWQADSGTFLDCLTREIDDDLEVIRSHRQQTQQLFVQIFGKQQYQCTSYFGKKTGGSRDQSNGVSDYFNNGDLVRILQDDRNNYFSAEPQSVQLIADGVAILREMLWGQKVVGQDGRIEYVKGLATNQDLSRCILKQMRDKFFDFMEDCIGPKINSPNFRFGRPDQPIPTTTQINELKEYVELYAKAYVLVRHCNNQEGVIREMTAEATRETCDCAKSSFCYCKSEYDQICPTVKPCISELINNPDALMRGYKNQGKGREDRPALISGMLSCINYAKQRHSATKCASIRRQFGANSAQARECASNVDLPRFLDLKDQGEELVKNFKAMDKGAQKELGEFVQRIAEAHFQTDFCQNCQFSVSSNCQ